MKKLLSKVLALTLCICTMVGLATSASAAGIQPRDTAANAVVMKYGSNSSSIVMNALTWGVPNTSTYVSLWTGDGTDAQKFYTNNHRLYNKMNGSIVVGMETSSSKAKLVASNSNASICYIDAFEVGGVGVEPLR